MKILIENTRDKLSFSVYKKDISEENLNNTNIISARKIIFEDKYIHENLDLVSSFLKTVVLKVEINSVHIKHNIIAPLVLKIIANIDSIDSIHFQEEQPIYYDIGSVLAENHNLVYINCFSMPNFLFDRLSTLHDLKIDLRSETLYMSNFMEYNKISTYSEIYYRKIIAIKSELATDHIEDIEAFFDINTKLRIIELEYYSLDTINILLPLLKKYNVYKIKIIIFQNEKDTEVLNNCVGVIKNKYNKFIKKQNITVKVKYSDIYKKTMMIKQVNLSLIRTIIIAILILSIAFFYIIKNDEQKAKKSIDEINYILKQEWIEDDPFIDNNEADNKGDVPVEPVEPVDPDNSTPTNSYDNPYYKNYERLFSKLSSINSDTVGWLTLNNTDIDYPVVQQKDNIYYLNRNFYKEKNILGWIFLDYRIDIANLSKNNIIYGHNTNSGLMFGTLKNILNESWYTNINNQIISFNTIHGSTTWQIFSIYVIEATNDYLITDFRNDENFGYFIEREKERSIYNFNVEVGNNDKILTLSTCHDGPDYRLVVHAKLLP